MPDPKRQGGLDWFKILAALLVVAIHTSPLTTYSAAGDFFLTRVLGRVAVPFFFLVTGQFILGPVLAGRRSPALLWRQGKKILLLYGAAILLYLPLGLYAGHYQDLTLGDALRLLVFDGTFYHLWYFPACLMGLAVVFLLSRVCRGKGLLAAVALLYLVGLGGDSYYGLTAALPPLASAYDLGFQLYTYTRNGLWMAPLFLFLGARLGQPPARPAPARWALGLILSFGGMTAEAFLLRQFALQRHDSMYLLLPVVMVFLYRLLQTWSVRAPAGLPTLSTWVYVLHPAMLVVVRGAAGVLGLTGLLVTNSLGHYLAVCLLSFLVSGGIAWLSLRRQPPRPRRDRAWITLDRQALCHNAKTLQALLPAGCQLMPVLKANAYGHGALPVARVLARQGISSFCVATLEEGIQLRRGGVRGDLLILGYTHPDQFPLLRRYRLTQTVVDLPYARQLSAFGKTLPVHLAVDTGMHRLGIPAADLDEILTVFSLPHLRLTGLYTHLCTADGADPASQGYVHRQQEAFRQLLEELKNRGLTLPKVHLLASHGLLNYPAYGGDWARVGIALYGLLSSPKDRNTAAPALRPVLSLSARVATVRALAPGAAAGYGRAFTAQRPTRLAVLTIGYGDGLPRNLTGGQVLLHGHRAPIVGRICMDQTLVDVTDLPPVQAGDVAVLIGSDGTETLSAVDLACQSGTITNEILSRLGPRLERVLS